MKSIDALPLLPREKLLRFGVKTLTDSELLAIFLRTGTKGVNVLTLSQQLLIQFGSLYRLINSDLSEFKKGQGVGVVKYVQLQAIIELSKRYLKEKLHHENVFTHPTQLYQFLASSLANRQQEVFLVMFLDNQHQIICTNEMFFGTYNSVEVHPREIIRHALKYNAAALILAHNHPSGRSEPSMEDRMLTHEITKACSLFDVRVVDHIVIGQGEYVSFAERGWI